MPEDPSIVSSGYVHPISNRHAQGAGIGQLLYVALQYQRCHAPTRCSYGVPNEPPLCLFRGTSVLRVTAQRQLRRKSASGFRPNPADFSPAERVFDRRRGRHARQFRRGGIQDDISGRRVAATDIPVRRMSGPALEFVRVLKFPRSQASVAATSGIANFNLVVLVEIEARARPE